MVKDCHFTREQYIFYKVNLLKKKLTKEGLNIFNTTDAFVTLPWLQLTCTSNPPYKPGRPCFKPLLRGADRASLIHCSHSGRREYFTEIQKRPLASECLT